jgi:hypothetical protein
MVPGDACEVAQSIARSPAQFKQSRAATGREGEGRARGARGEVREGRKRNQTTLEMASQARWHH